MNSANDMNLILFSNEEFGEIRTATIDRKPYLCGSDVAKALGYQRPNDAISAHCKYTVKHSIPHPQSKNTSIEMIFIPEGDVYRLIMKSKLPSAEKFESWVMDEVLPQIRKTGGYIPVSQEDDELTIMSKAMMIMQKTLEKKDELVQELKPKALVCDNRIDKRGSLTLTDVTKSLGLKTGQISVWARNEGYLNKSRIEVNQKGEGYFITWGEEYPSYGITEKGLKLINDKIEEIKKSPCKMPKTKKEDKKEK